MWHQLVKKDESLEDITEVEGYRKKKKHVGKAENLRQVSRIMYSDTGSKRHASNTLVGRGKIPQD